MMASRSNSISVCNSFYFDGKFEGLLEKQSRFPGSFMGKKYWCVLQNDKLSYYKSANNSESSCGYIDVTKMQSVKKASKGNGFTVVVNSGTHTFIAGSAEMRDQWVKAIQDAMSMPGRRRDQQRLSCISITGENWADETSKAAPSPNFPSLSAVEQYPSIPSKPSVGSDDRKVTADHHVAERDTLRSADDDRVSSCQFQYVNAGDLAVALPDNKQSSTRVKSVHSDDETEATNSDNCPTLGESPDRRRTPSPSELTLPHPQTLDDTMETRNDNTNAAAAAAETQSKSSLCDVVCVSDPGLESDPVMLADVVPIETSAVTQSATVSNIETPAEDPSTKQPPQRPVTMRRPSQVAQVPDPPAPAQAVVEVHIDTEFKPTVVSELDHIPRNSRSGIQQLQQFLENQSVSDQSSPALPSAIQPGKAFDSLKYFLSTMD